MNPLTSGRDRGATSPITMKFMKISRNESLETIETQDTKKMIEEMKKESGESFLLHCADEERNSLHRERERKGDSQEL